MPHHIQSLGDITVEVTDKVKQAESSDPNLEYPEERNYREVTILDSGWVRCVSHKDSRDSESDDDGVDYYPPQVVNGVYSVEDN